MSKKQIWVVYRITEVGDKFEPIMMTSSVTKVKSFLIQKIKNKEAIYVSDTCSITKQLQQFKFDFKYRNMTHINNNLLFYYYDYYYDGEELN
jgi:hypothetical protein